MTTFDTGPEEKEKDSRGRTRYSRERRDALLDDFEKSGMNTAQFARWARIKYSTFANWVARRRKSRGARDGCARTERAAKSPAVETARGGVRWFEAVLNDGADQGRSTTGTGDGLQIELPGGSRVLVEAPGQLALAAQLVVLIERGARQLC